MSLITSGTTLGDVVTADPSLARQLERHGLDYCCGGSRTIACGSQGLAVAAVIAELTTDADPPSPAWATVAADELADHLYRGLAELEADTHLHVHKENNVLFPMAERIELQLEP